MKHMSALDEDLAKTYNRFKTFEGKPYTGMKVGGHHKWSYDQGEWKETKKTPDLWEFTFAVHKRRAGHAPPGSGVPVGTEYHWYILAHQIVRKVDENTYTTAMSGLKYKVAHKRADKATWSASEAAQRRRLIRFLEEMVGSLKREAESVPSAAQEVPVNGQGRRKPRARVRREA
ncbi:MAG: hypothetical protein JO332_15130 [Planctomycetaceae bacterium]|nr:hypothetical protein [Planctomycetaceae bacterium]